MATHPKHTMAGKTSLVTGSTDGIGLACARELLARGSKLMFTGIFTPGAARTAEQHKAQFMAELEALKASHGENSLDFLEVDLTAAGAPEALVDRAQKLGGGRIDSIVHSAGVQRAKGLYTSSPLTSEDMRFVYAVNAQAGFDVILAARPYLENTGDSRSQIVFLSSVHGLVGSPEREAYCASKFAIEGFMAASKHEFAAKNIRINAVNPAFIETALAVNPLRDMAKKQLAAEGTTETSAGYDAALEAAYAEKLAHRLHLQGGKWIPMQEIIDGVVNLCDFSDGIESGANVRLDNGYVDRGHAEAGAAIFRFDKQSPDLRTIMDAFNARNAALAHKA